MADDFEGWKMQNLDKTMRRENREGLADVVALGPTALWRLGPRPQIIQKFTQRHTCIKMLVFKVSLKCHILVRTNNFLFNCQ